MANGEQNFGFDQLFPAGLPETPTGAFKPLFEPVQKAQQVQQASERAKQSLVEKRGISPDSPEARLINLGASLVSGASRVAGNLATLPIDAISGLAQASVPEDAVQAFNRVQRNEASPEDLALLGQTAPGDDGAPQTYMERLQGTIGLQKVGKAVDDFFDITSIVDQTDRERLSRDLKESTAEGTDQLREAGRMFEDGNYADAALVGAEGLARTIGNALVTGVQSPGAVSEYVAENIPQLAAAAINPAAAVATNAGYGFDVYRESMTDYLENNNGQLADAGERGEAALWALSAAAAEQVGDLALLRSMRGTADGARRGVVAGATDVAGAAAREGVTEGYQTYAEAKAEFRDPSLDEIVEGATIGALVGGNFQGAATVARAGAQAERTTLDSQAQAAAVEEAFTSAVETGDVSALADPQLPTYDPVRAVDALNEVSRDAAPEVVEANLAQADSIQQALTEQVSDVQARLDTNVEKATAELTTLREDMIAANAPQADLDYVDAELAALQEYTPERRQADEAQVAKLQSQLDAVKASAERMRIDTSPEQADVAVIAEEAQAGNVDATNRLLTLTMTNPDAVPAEVADALAQSDALSEPQRTAMARFSEAQVAANELKGRTGVRSDIATGGDGFKGITDYRNALRMALANGDVQAARSQVDGLASFAASRVSKLEAITTAYEQVKGTDASINIVRNEQGVWGPTELQGKALKEAGGLVIDRKSFRLRDDVSLEADVLNKTAAAYSAMVDAAPAAVARPEVAPAVAEQPQVAAPAAEPAVEPTVAPVDVAPASVAETSEAVAPQPVETAGVTALENVTPSTEPETAPAETGVLSVVRDRTGAPVTAENYTSVNLVGELFEQNAGSETSASVRPLVAYKDFMSKVRAGEVSYSDVLAQEAPLTMPQQAALDSFVQFARYSEQAIRDVFKVTETRAKRPDFYYRDMAQFLQNADGSIDENLATAVSFGMFSWINENATQLRNSDEAINAILLRDLDAEVSDVERAALGNLGIRESVVASQLGGRIVQALGLQPTQAATNAELSKLEASIGARALGAMANLGLITREQISDVKLQALMKTGEPGNKNMPHTFVRVKASEVNGRMTAAPLVARIRERNVGSQSVLSKLFSVEAAGVEPSYQPVPFEQKFAKRTKQDVPKVLAETLEKEGAKAHRVRQNMWHIWGRLSTDALAAIGGAVDVSDTPTHVENMEGRRAKSDGIRQQVENFDTFVKAMIADESTNGLEQDLFFGRSVWKPQRVGLTANVINPQTSKVHRHMMAMEGWGATVSFDNPASMANYKLRILEALGVKTEADLTANVLAGYEAKVSNPTIQAGVDALVDVLRDNNVPTNEAAILAAVEAGGENFHSFDALVALAEEKIARQDGKPGFDTQMMGEVDGLTNGPMLSIAMLGAKGWETMVQGGFFPQDSQYTQFNQYKADGGLDLYESNIAASVNRLQGTNLAKLNALQVITGQLATDEGKVTKKGRNAIKKPLTALMFGSKPKNAVDGMADGFIESIYTKMEGAATNRSQAEMREIVEAVNALIPNKRLHMDVGLGYDVVLNTRLSDAQKSAIKETFYELLGKPTEDALADTYATFLARRDVINQTAETAYFIYNAVRDGVIEQVTELSDAVPRNAGGEAIRTLTRAQQAQVDAILGDMAPILQTAMSQVSNQHAAGMYMAKSQRMMDSSKPFESEVAFGTSVETVGMDGMMKGIGSSRVSAATRGDIAPGPMPFITSIHSMDSSIASTVYGQMTALNVHDALGVDLNNMEKVGQELNKATFNNLMEYSSATAMSNMLDQVLAGAARIMQDEALAARIQPKLKQVAEARKTSFEDQVTAIRTTATQADTDKLNMLASMKAVGQYATEGGSYMVTDADRAAASKKLAEVGSTFAEASPAIAQELDTFGAMDARVPTHGAAIALSAQSLRTLAPATSLNSLDSLLRTAEGQLRDDVQETMAVMADNNIPLASAVQALPEERAADVVAAVASVTPAKMSVWGQLGAPVVQSDVNLVQLLESTPDMTAQQLAVALEAYVTDPFQKTVLQMARRSLPSTVGVKYVTSVTDANGAYGEGVDKSRGWYAQRGNRADVFIKSPEFVESGITAEMLTHELVHVALANLVDQHQGKQSAVGRAVAELETIRAAAAEFIGNNGALSAKYRNATSNVHELLAWGLTNQDFQKEVLAAVNVQTRNTGLLDGLKAFIQKITAMLFNGSVKETSGMANLVAQSAGLFREAAAMRASRETKTLKYEDEVDAVNNLTAVQVFDSMTSLPGNKPSAEHSLYLRDLLESTVDPIYGPYDVNKERAKRHQALTPLDAMLKAVQTGTLPFSTAATTHAFITTQEEAFVLESVEAVFQHALDNPNTLFVRQALSDLLAKARNTLKPQHFFAGDWTVATPDERKIAEAKHAFLFESTNVGGKDALLGRFAALGLASQEVRNVLSFSTPNSEVPLKSLPWASRLTELFRRVMTKLASLHTKVRPGMPANESLDMLMQRLVDIEAKRKLRLIQKKSVGLDEAEAFLAGAGGTTLEKLDALGKSKFMRESRIPGFKLAGVALSTLAGDRLDGILGHITKMRDATQRSPHGVLMGMLTDWRGNYDSKRLANELQKGAKAIEQRRKAVIENTAANVNASFANGGQDLTDSQRSAVTKFFLKTNSQAIEAARGMDFLKEALNDKAVMDQYRRELEREVATLTPEHLYMISQTKDLAHHRVVGGATSSRLMQNTLAIATLATFRPVEQTKDTPVLVAKLDQLMAVYALEYSASEVRKEAMEVMRTETARGKENGIAFTLMLHRGLQQKAAQELFANTQLQQMTGFTPEIHDNKIEVLLIDPKEEAKYLRAGYQTGTRTQTDPNYQFAMPLMLMTRRGAGQPALVTGALSYTGKSARGSRPVTEAKNLLVGDRPVSAKELADIIKAKAAEDAALFHRPLSYDPRRAKAGHLAPTLAPDGKIADYRHLMTEHNRDVLLDRDSSMDQVLGVFAGQIVDQVDSAAQNADVIGATHDQYRADYKNRPGSYLAVGPNSEDPWLRELYRLMSYETKQRIKKVWKSDTMYVPADQINLIFGYRRYSLTNAFTEAPEDRNVFEKALVGITGALLGEKAEWRVGQAEDMWQALVSEMKDIIVVKNIITLAYNIMSNMTLLAWQGVSLKSAAASHAVAIKGALDWRKDAKRLMQLEQMLEVGYVARTEAVETEIAALKDRMARNPIKPLIDAGLMPTIVEDVEVNDNRYSYKSVLARKVERFSSKVPSWLLGVGKQAYMTHDTSTYKFLSQTTQLSDLVSRYALYEHLISRKKDPMSQADALRRAEDSFINYDLPLHRTLDYLDRMGIVPFIKYAIRIQRVIMTLVREHPARALMLVMLNHYWSGLQSVMDSSWVNKLGNNPFQAGALGYIDTLKELPVIKLLR